MLSVVHDCNGSIPRREIQHDRLFSPVCANFTPEIDSQKRASLSAKKERVVKVSVLPDVTRTPEIIAFAWARLGRLRLL